MSGLGRLWLYRAKARAGGDGSVGSAFFVCGCVGHMVGVLVLGVDPGAVCVGKWVYAIGVFGLWLF
ncbi:hypothetical protein, partial [Pseudomonas syringae group genomosp. 7]|uniref:hypothetical protein n=1 Tax=Pseudomonas syringae group genomosp. 7 TaxID=251699 RepID=UPI0037702375